MAKTVPLEPEPVGMPVAGIQKLRVGVREYEWLGRALRAVEFFSNLTLGQLERILPSIALFKYPEGHTIIREGDHDEALFVLYRGRVVISRRKKWRLFNSPIKSLLPGDFFGEIALLEHRPRTASVGATEESLIFVLQAEDFRFILEKNPDLDRRIRQVATERKFELEQWEKQ